jgi:uracil-DNA glycosylase family 4
LQELVDQIHACVKCEELTGNKRVQTKAKKIPIDYNEPYHKVKILFVAESPSTSGGYFYKPNGANNPSSLRSLLFKQLIGEELMSKPTLEEFKRNYYLADVVKCPFKNLRNGRNSAPSRRAIENCNPFLLEEIKLMQPEIICTLGKNALRGFVKATRFRLGDYQGEVPKGILSDSFAALGIPVYACYFPSAMVPWKKKFASLRGLARLIGL